ncbi:alcohol oxidase [Vararia minispora EC-137]|uniref:Alcohol oxidase n=1 Tax=Vararia minispora EC-137 TaxID=1314806 RepID=A0ACB8QPT4_9AGAM|nr:alcohol oxidase [Vararia minispora EC-137]
MPIVTIAEFVETVFDYVIIGGGTAGLAVAARLTEDSNTVVGVVEAGCSHLDSPDVKIPGLAIAGLSQPSRDWTFLSTPQEHIGNRPVYQPRGKGLGGSSALNFLLMGRPSKADIDALETLGNKGWNWDTLLPYFKRSERFVSPEDPAIAKELGIEIDPAFHGTDGPIIKSCSSWVSPLSRTMNDAFRELGVDVNPDPAKGINIGIDAGLGSIDPDTATRSYAASGYYAPNAERKNLVVLTDAMVSKILLESGPNGLKRAVGVNIIHAGRKYEVRGVRKDVVVSAGAFQTPVVLELSGIGSPEVLAKHGIDVLIDLPGVGENLQDHVITHIIYEVNPAKETMDILGDPALLAQQQELYKSRKGILSGLCCRQFAYIAAPTLHDKETLSRWQNEVFGGQLLPSGTEKQYSVIRDWLMDPTEANVEIMGFAGHWNSTEPTPVPAPVPGKRYYSMVSSLMHPFSRGSVHLSSPTDPASPPVIDPRYLSHPLDLAILTSSTRFALRLFKTAAAKTDSITCVIPSKGEEDGVEDHVKETLANSFHPLGTAAMMPREDGGVVDSDLKVYGTSNLRIIDASILPMEVSAHLQTIVYAIAEKGADILKGVVTAA